MKPKFPLIIGGLYEPTQEQINGDPLPLTLQLVSADLTLDKVKLLSINSFVTIECNRATLEYYFKPTKKIKQ